MPPTDSSTKTTATTTSHSSEAHFSESGERRLSDSWDASKVPPSQFQRRPGSIYSTPNSKDGHVERGDRDKAYFEKLREKVRYMDQVIFEIESQDGANR
jgi:hypothetical protein